MNIQQLREQIVALQDATMDENGNFHSDYDEGKFDALTAIDNLLDSLQEEPVSEDLGEYINELSKQFPEVSFAKLSRIAVRVAKWQKEQIEEALLSEVLGNFMHGGEADEVVAKLDEVLNPKK